MTVLQNNPLLWRDKLPVPDPQGHKYGRGVAVIYGAPKMTGATRLAARACARIGAGLVRVLAPAGAADVYRKTLHEEIIVEEAAAFAGFADPKVRAFAMGSGLRAGDVDTRLIEEALKAPNITGIVLDAGGFAAWNGNGLGRIVVTPHDGEFDTRFGKADGRDRIARAQMAAEKLNAVVVLKGPQTIIADHNGVVVQTRDVPELATAGTGDVLAGMITGLIAQGMELRWAAAASVWIHAEAGARFGRGLVAGDLPELIPAILKELS